MFCFDERDFLLKSFVYNYTKTLTSQKRNVRTIRRWKFRLNQ